MKSIGLLFVLAAFVFTLAALFSYNAGDPGVFALHGAAASTHNIEGLVGAYYADMLINLFGYIAFILPFVVLTAFVSIRELTLPFMRKFILGFLGVQCFIFGLCSLVSLYALHGVYPNGPGGWIGFALVSFLTHYVHAFGTMLIGILTMILGLQLCTQKSWLELIRFLMEKGVSFLKKAKVFFCPP